MRSAGLLSLLLLLALSACSSGQDPWNTDGWVNNQMDYETDFWEKQEEPAKAPCRPAPGTTAPAAPRSVPMRAPAVLSTPAWTSPAPAGTTPPPPPPPAWPPTR